MSEESKFIKALKHNSIRTKLVIIMILISAIPIFILGVTSIFEFTQNSNLNFEQNGISLGESVEKHVDSKFKAVEDIANYIIEKHKFDDSEEDKLSLDHDFTLFKEGNSDIEFCYYYSEHKKDFVMYPHDSMPEDDYINDTSYSVTEESGQVYSAIGEVTSAIGEILKGSIESAENLATLRNDLEYVSREINKINALIQNINDTSSKSNNLGRNGIDIIKIIMEKSNNTKDSTIEVNKVVSKVEASVKSIAIMN